MGGGVNFHWPSYYVLIMTNRVRYHCFEHTVYDFHMLIAYSSTPEGECQKDYTLVTCYFGS